MKVRETRLENLGHLVPSVTTLILSNNLYEGVPNFLSSIPSPIFLAFASYPINACTNIEVGFNVPLRVAQIY